MNSEQYPWDLIETDTSYKAMLFELDGKIFLDVIDAHVKIAGNVYPRYHSQIVSKFAAHHDLMVTSEDEPKFFPEQNIKIVGAGRMLNYGDTFDFFSESQGYEKGWDPEILKQVQADNPDKIITHLDKHVDDL